MMFALLIFLQYFVAMLVREFLSCPFTVKNISPWWCFSVYILYTCELKSLNIPIVIFGVILEFVTCEHVAIDVFWKNLKSYQLLPLFVIVRKLSVWSVCINFWIQLCALLKDIDCSWSDLNCNDCSLVLNLPWLS